MKPGVPIGAVRAAAFEIPTDQPEADGTLAWSSTVLVVAWIEAGGVEGVGWTYAGRAAATIIEGTLANVLTGAEALDLPGANQAMLRAVRNLGQPGVAACAVSALDVALWDLKARLLEVPLTALLGKATAEVPLYGSGGFTTYDDRTTSAQVERWVSDLALRRVKIKIGESWGSNERRDLHRVSLVRQVAGDDVELYVDANGAYRAKQAIRLGNLMHNAWSATWFEEPVSSDDLVGLRHVRDHCPMDVAAGEYGYSPWYYTPLLSAGCLDCVQADVTRCGGISGFLAVAQLAAANHLDISGHCAPYLHAPVAVATPNLRHVEYFHDHVRIEQLLFDGLAPLESGALRPEAAVAGHGMTLKDADAERFRIA